MLHWLTRACVLVASGLILSAPSAPAQSRLSPARVVPRVVEIPCTAWEPERMRRNPTAAELRCRFGIRGAGRFGLADYSDVPVYQPDTPLPGTHVVGLPGFPAPRPGESYEAWEWRLLRTQFPGTVRQVHRSLDLLDPVFAERIMELERLLAQAGIRFTRRETWRSPERQAFLFQQGRSRPGAIVTTTLTSWHSRLDERGAPAARAVDYDVPRSQMPFFHEIVWAVGLESYGPDSNDPGHVYLEGAEDIAESELVFLRLLPRVPSVTMRTGRPTDEYVTRAEREEFRTLAAEWVYAPYFREPLPGLAFTWGTPRLTPVVPPDALPAQPAPVDGVVPNLVRAFSRWTSRGK